MPFCSSSWAPLCVPLLCTGIPGMSGGVRGGIPGVGGSVLGGVLGLIILSSTVEQTWITTLSAAVHTWSAALGAAVHAWNATLGATVPWSVGGGAYCGAWELLQGGVWRGVGGRLGIFGVCMY